MRVASAGRPIVGTYFGPWSRVTTAGAAGSSKRRVFTDVPATPARASLALVARRQLVLDRTPVPHVSASYRSPETTRWALVVARDEVLRGLLLDILSDLGVTAQVSSSPNCARVSVEHLDPDVLIVVTRDPAANRDLIDGRRSTVLITDDPARWSAADLGVSSILPLIFDVGELEQALHRCLG
jgi:hypothetical protein